MTWGQTRAEVKAWSAWAELLGQPDWGAGPGTWAGRGLGGLLEGQGLFHTHLGRWASRRAARPGLSCLGSSGTRQTGLVTDIP